MTGKVLIVDDDAGVLKQALMEAKYIDDIIVLDSKEAIPMKGYGEAAALIAAFSGNAFNHEIERFERKAYRPTKQCLECGKDHQHNNSWCSSECCRAYRTHER